MDSASRAGQWLRIGEVVKRTGLTERALRHYEREGLIDPPQRSGAGYRLYGSRALAQIHQVLALKAMGWPLAQIALRGRDQNDPCQLVDQQIARLQEQIGARHTLLQRLHQVRQQLRSQPQPTLDSLLNAIEVTQMYDRHYTQDQLVALRQRATELGDAAVDEVQAEWPRLIDQAQALLTAATPADDPRVIAVARRWMQLVQQFTGGDPAITASLNRMYQQEPAAQQHSGVSAELMAYVREALTAAGPG